MSVSQPCESASGIRYLFRKLYVSVGFEESGQEWGRRGPYSSFRVLFPPNAIPELQSSLFAQIDTFPPRAEEIRGKWWTGEGPKRKVDLGIEAKGSGRVMGSGAMCKIFGFDEKAGDFGCV
jgi:hypothetical protein